MKPLNNKFRFFICTLNPRGSVIEKCREIFPANADQLKIVQQREEKRVFLRRKLSGNLVLINTNEIQDYSYIKSIEAFSLANPLYKYILKIQRLNGTIWEDYWFGSFNIIGCKFNDDRCTVEINNIDTYDEYKCILDNIEHKYNLFDLPYVYECISPNIKYEIETETRVDEIKKCHGWFSKTSYTDATGDYIWQFVPETGTNNGSGSTDTTPKDALYTYPNYFANGFAVVKYKWEMKDKSSMKFKLTTTFARRTTITADVNGVSAVPVESGSWVELEATTISGLSAHKWYDSSYPDLVNVQSPDYMNILPNAEVSFWIGTTYGSHEILVGQWTWNSNFDTITHSRNRMFLHMIRNIVEGCGLNLVSHFFEDTINYVTGEENKLINLLVSSKADIKRYDATLEPQTIAYYAFKNIEEWLIEMFNCYWYIDGADLIIEHISRIKTYAVGRNLKLIENGKYIKATNSYEYDYKDVNIIERWKFMESYGVDFIGKDIYYFKFSTEIERPINNHDIPLMTTDINYVQYVSSAISDEGFVMLACNYTNGVLEVINEKGLISNQLVSNGHLSLANLHYNYHRHNRDMAQGYMNDLLTDFLSTKKIKKQIDISFPMYAGDILDEFKLIKTNMGDGEVLNAEFNLKTEMQTVTLIY